MIYGLFGRPRSGKSYEAVRYYIIEAIKDGRLVVTNIPLNLDAIEMVYGEEAAELVNIVKTEFGAYGTKRPFSDPEDYTKYQWRNEDGQGPLFVIDEAHLCLGRDADKKVLEYLSMHGHYGHDIYLLSQNPRKINRDVKDMVEISWRFVKKSVYGEDRGYLKKCYHGVGVSNAEFLDMVEREYDPAFFRFYQSHTQSNTSVNEMSAPTKVNKLQNKKLIIALFAVGGLLIAFTVKRVFSPNPQQPAAVVQEQPIKTQPKVVSETRQSQSSLPPQAPIPESTTQQQTNGEALTQTFGTQPKETRSAKTVNEMLYDRRAAQSKQFHPFFRVQLHIRGMSVTGDYDAPVKRLSLTASQNGQSIFSITSADLIAAGYQVEIYGECSALIRYFEYEDFLTCDSPTLGVQTASF